LTSTFSNCKNYLKDVLSWHGYVKFLGLPTLQNNPDIPIDDLYVAQSLSYKYLSPDLAPAQDDLKNPVELLARHKNIVVLGDPGSGKSTLINWFSWFIASEFENQLPDGISDLLPVPIVLRDLNFKSINTFCDLISEFLRRPIAKNLDSNLLQEYLASGKVLFLIDGLDEVGSEHREKLKNILVAGMIGHNSCYSISTSRIVGYEEDPIDKPIEKKSYSKYFSSKSLAQLNFISAQKKLLVHLSETNTNFNTRVFVAPFTKSQISKFSLNWYKEQGDESGANLLRFDFLKAISDTPSIFRLARTPNLLTMMALIFKVKSQLPNGRALLYNDIAQAYLESIDTARKLKDPISWQKKRFWLARIGFEMQFRRTEDALSSEQDLLVPHSEILNWLKEAMSVNGDNISNDYAEKYLDWITKRSGLLIPRGEKLFSFLHLSFQEYFSALYIQLQMQDPSWLEKTIDDTYEDEDDNLDDRVSKEFLTQCAGDIAWQQPLIFLFELFDGQNNWTKRLWKYTFNNDSHKQVSDYFQGLVLEADFDLNKKEHESWYNLGDPLLPPEIRLQSILLLNPHSGLFGKLKKEIIQSLYNVAMVQQEFFIIERSFHLWNGYSPLLSELLSSDITKHFCLSEIKEDATLKSLVLDKLNSPDINLIIEDISHNNNIDTLSLIDSAIDNIDSIAKFSNLKTLILHDTKISNISMISNLKNLQVLACRNTKIENFDELSKVKSLVRLDLSQNKLSNLEFIQGLTDLEYFRISFTDVSDIAPLSNLLNLQTLILNSTNVSDISPLINIKGLDHLNLNQTMISDISDVKNFSNLEYLGINETTVNDLSALINLEHLAVLSESGISEDDCLILKDKPYYKNLHFHHEKKLTKEN
jgi:internalin A